MESLGAPRNDDHEERDEIGPIEEMLDDAEPTSAHTRGPHPVGALTLLPWGIMKVSEPFERYSWSVSTLYYGSKFEGWRASIRLWASISSEFALKSDTRSTAPAVFGRWDHRPGQFCRQPASALLLLLLLMLLLLVLLLLLL